MPDKLKAIARTSRKESSLRITLPKEVAEKLDISVFEKIKFYDLHRIYLLVFFPLAKGH